LYLLDTNVVSELRRTVPHAAVVAWLHSVDHCEVHISALTIGEIQAGIEIARGWDKLRADAAEAWLEQVAATGNVLAIDATTLRCWARLMQGLTDDFIEDALIAATALVHDLTVVTRDVRDFAELGVRTFNPFEWRG
jgi:predicted nucleic acid-binding protein